MRKISDYIDTLISTLLGVSMPSSPEMPIDLADVEKSQYIQSFKKEEKYQWPVHVSISEITHKTRLEEWKPISEDVEPKSVGEFAPVGYLNPKHPHGHQGMDLVAPLGTAIYPVGPGVVVKVDSTDDYNPGFGHDKGGITAHISHEEGNVVSYYAHMRSVNVSTGQEVDFSTVIGTVGTSGNAKGTQPHLHYSIKVRGRLVNPRSIVGKPVGSLYSQAKKKRFNEILKVATKVTLSDI